MDRMAIALVLLAGLLAGCHGSTAAVDPFAPYAPTKLAPPATGSARRTDPYYSRSLASTASGTVSSPGAAAPPLSPITRFTSDDERVQMADNRGAVPAATAAGNAPATVTQPPPPVSAPTRY